MGTVFACFYSSKLDLYVGFYRFNGFPQEMKLLLRLG